MTLQKNAKKRDKRVGSLAALGIAILLITNLTSVMSAETFTINSTVDEVDESPGNRVCATAAGECTLRAAIQETNALVGDDVIILPSDNYFLTIGGFGEDDAAEGDLDITDNLSIQGIRGQNGIRQVALIDVGGRDRAFHIFRNSRVEISNVSINRGNSHSGSGGGIFNSGHLTLIGGVLSESETEASGGGIGNNGHLILNSFDISYNSAETNGGGIFSFSGTVEVLGNTNILSNYAGGSGGGIYNINSSLIIHGARDVLPGTRVTSNIAHSKGGGVYTKASNVRIKHGNFSHNATLREDGGGLYIESGDTTVEDGSTFFSNSAVTDCGGGLFLSQGTLEISNTLFENNYSQCGGGVYNSGSGDIKKIEYSIFRDNISLGSGGGLSTLSHNEIDINFVTFSNNSALRGGGINNENGDLTVTNSTIDNNHASLDGGGVENGSGSISMKNVTISKNTANRNGGGISNSSDRLVNAEGQVLRLFEGNLALVHVTVFENLSLQGRQIFNQDGNVEIKNSIIAHDPSERTSVANCQGAITSLGQNLFTDLSCSAQTEDFLEVNAQLGRLTNNGGFASTHALQPNSRAINNGADCPAYDQRGVARPQNGQCDIGSFEILANGEPTVEPRAAFDFGDAPIEPFPSSPFDQGVLHVDNQKLWLGQVVSYEEKPRFLDQDMFDDTPFQIVTDTQGNQVFETAVSSSADSPPFGYLNVLVDFEGSCAQPDPLGWSQTRNHIVRNERFNVAPDSSSNIIQVPTTDLNFNLNNLDNHWVRITLTDEPISPVTGAIWDGRANKIFLTGETEDHCKRPEREFNLFELDEIPFELILLCNNEYSHMLTIKWAELLDDLRLPGPDEVNVTISITLPNGETIERRWPNEIENLEEMFFIHAPEGGDILVTLEFRRIASGDPTTRETRITLGACN